MYKITVQVEPECSLGGADRAIVRLRAELMGQVVETHAAIHLASMPPDLIRHILADCTDSLVRAAREIEKPRAEELIEALWANAQGRYGQ